MLERMSCSEKAIQCRVEIIKTLKETFCLILVTYYNQNDILKVHASIKVTIEADDKIELMVQV